MTVAGLVLAAGAGRRYGGPKALARRDGRLFTEIALAALTGGGCAPVVVVLGASADEVRARAELGGAVVVDNPDWRTGMGSSLRAGLAALEEHPVGAVVVLPVDTPGVTAGAVRRVIDTGGDLVRAVYDGVPGHPVLIGREHWAGVAALATGDTGARPYLAGHAPVEVECGDVADGADVDTP